MNTASLGFSRAEFANAVFSRELPAQLSGWQGALIPTLTGPWGHHSSADLGRPVQGLLHKLRGRSYLGTLFSWQMPKVKSKTNCRSTLNVCSVTFTDMQLVKASHGAKPTRKGV